MRRRRAPVGLALGLMLLAVGAGDPPDTVGAVGEDPVAEVTEALEALGPPGLLWGRIAVEEESPVGPWTPLEGIEVTLYPATPTLIAELERIRQGARGSAAEFEAAVARVQAALAVHQGRIDRHNALTPEESLLVAEPPLIPPFRTGPLSPTRSAATKGGTTSKSGASTTSKGGTPPASGGASTSTSGPSTPSKDAPSSTRSSTLTTPARSGATTTSSLSTTGDLRLELPHPWRRKTDPAGLFVFTAVPAGEWVVVALRISPYASEKLRAEPKNRQPARSGSGRQLGFLPRTTGPAKEAELWVTRVRIVAADRVGLELTDRARWLAGPVR